MVVMTRHDNQRTSGAANRTDEVNLLGRNNYTSNEGKEAIQYDQ